MNVLNTLAYIALFIAALYVIGTVYAWVISRREIDTLMQEIDDHYA